MLRNLIFASAVMLAAGSSQAVTFSSTPFNTLTLGQKVIVNFEKPTPGVTLSGNFSIQKGLTPGFAAPPAGDTTNYFATPSVNSESSSGTATINFTEYLETHSAFKTLSFYWGSIDRYNTLTLLGTGLSRTTFTGSDINNPANGDQNLPATNRRVNFTLAKGETLTGLRLTSTSRAFEIDDIATSVPEPATWAMLLAGFAMVGLATRSRTRSVAA